MNGGGGKLFLTLFALAVFEHFHGHETCSAGEDFVGELGFVVVVLDLRVLVTSFAWGGVCQWMNGWMGGCGGAVRGGSGDYVPNPNMVRLVMCVVVGGEE